MTRPDPQTGDRLGSWTLDQRIHRGNQTEIWRANGRGDAKAIKIALSNDWEHSLDREVNLLCDAQVTGVVRFIEAEAGGRWMAMDWVEGKRSSEWALHRNVYEISELLTRISDILARVHGLGIVHGDLAPGNILVDGQGIPVLLDFGLSVGPESIPPRLGLHGTPGYVAPELLDGGVPTPYSDAYALGALGYRLLTGHHPFGDVSLRALQLHPKVSIPAPPSSSRSDIPPEIDALILKLLSRDPSRRPTAAQVAPLWMEMASRPSARPLVGNLTIRSALRDAIAKVVDGESVHILVHGPDGSGRRQLISEATRIGKLAGIEAHISDLAEIDDLHELERNLAQAIETNEGLLLIRARHAVENLESFGLLHFRTTPLTVHDVEKILVYEGITSVTAAQIHADTQGHPAAVWARLGRPQAERAATPMAQRLLTSLNQGPLSIQEISDRIGISPHEVLDIADPLMNQGAVIELQQGRLLGLPEAKL